MKLSILCTFALGLSAVVAPVGLLAQDQIHTTIPFDFAVGAKALPAGDYVVRHPAPGIVSFQGTKGNSSTLVLVNSSSKRASQGKVYLTFNRYGSRHFLSKIAQFDNAWELPKSRQEKEMLANRAVPEPVVLAAATK